MGTDPFDDLAKTIEAEAHAAGIAISVERGTADGFGLTDASILSVVGIAGSAPVRVWNEGRGDVWFELPDDVTAAWWRQDEKKASLVEVVIALAQGRYSVDSGDVAVTLRDHSEVTLKSQL